MKNLLVVWHTLLPGHFWFYCHFKQHQFVINSMLSYLTLPSLLVLLLNQIKLYEQCLCIMHSMLSGFPLPNFNIFTCLDQQWRVTGHFIWLLWTMPMSFHWRSCWLSMSYTVNTSIRKEHSGIQMAALLWMQQRSGRHASVRNWWQLELRTSLRRLCWSLCLWQWVSFISAISTSDNQEHYVRPKPSHCNNNKQQPMVANY